MSLRSGSRGAWGRRATAAFLLLAAACGTSSASTTGRRTSAIVVASYDFVESKILAEVYGQALRAGGYTVQILHSVAAREIMEPALEQSQVDIVPEYQGTLLRFLNEGATSSALAPRDTHERLVQALAPLGLKALDYAPGMNRNEIAVTRETAQANDLVRISDLEAVDDSFIFGGPPECPSRPFCLVGLQRVYGLDFASFLPLDAGGPLTIAALDGGEIDAGLLFTTDPTIPLNDLVLLRDDRKLQPAENILPVMRQDVILEHGAAIERALDGITPHLTTQALRTLNAAVLIGGHEPAEVAYDWLVAEEVID